MSDLIVPTVIKPQHVELTLKYSPKSILFAGRGIRQVDLRC